MFHYKDDKSFVNKCVDFAKNECDQLKTDNTILKQIIVYVYIYILFMEQLLGFLFS